ncbi:MAG TPA: 4-hydroxythreonine-4-phosphate dehydrogenase PdxA [candidate division WOR-3 bacterium]|uniref:4-hydroxythreonine-4-phosphate dehydrogenase PdxA n=1 Tax=candidate division WOR-3 bacterium TaxID=2052148 RepID=A0A7C0V9K0_UNCW3|nr:4-hydroxythreonine-4-phosphate dehydrogenase PdxA [candidate division WOR-3 bacterium]
MVAITLGDPGGIGPEIVLKALNQVKGDFVLIGSIHSLKETSKICSIPLPDVDMIHIDGEYIWGKVSAHNGRIAYESLIRAIDLAIEGKVKGIVTAPLSKESLHLAGYNYPGQTEILAEKTGTQDYGMLMVSDDFRMLLLTTHIPLSLVPQSITEELIIRKVSLLNKTLKEIFKIENPRILLLGVNPHAGEDGLIGNEEKEKILPAIEKLRKEGIAVEGPVPPDTFFMEKGFDAYVAMYHDQGMIPFKLLFFHSGVNMTIGLPFIRTSPDHGTAFDIAGRCIADHRSMLSAIKLCKKLCFS